MSLRNYPLHINQNERLGLPGEQYAMAMADALASLHWVAEVDACDVGYILAPTRESRMSVMSAKRHPRTGVQSFTRGVLGPLAL